LKLKKTKIITLMARWNGLVNELEQLKEEDWKHKRDTSDVMRALKRIEEIQIEWDVILVHPADVVDARE